MRILGLQAVRIERVVEMAGQLFVEIPQGLKPSVFPRFSALFDFARGGPLKSCPGKEHKSKFKKSKYDIGSRALPPFAQKQECAKDGAPRVLSLAGRRGRWAPVTKLISALILVFLTAAVYGQLAGAFYGETGIPANWRERLAKSDLIVSLADRLHELSDMEGHAFEKPQQNLK